jgi:two-component system nitrogen regulation response regulator NtrX
MASSRCDGPFVEVNCAAIPENLIESQLFGHEKGAFTDAISTRKGRFETARGGTLFLDEIGDMSLSAQAKVLRVIQEQKMERVGGERVIETDVRIIAATNQNLQKACEEGRFRQDLFFRLNVIPLHIPPLRERPQDIPLLFFHFLKMFNAEITPDSEAMELLTAHDWPGNVRELKNLAERIAVMHQENSISAEALQKLINRKETMLSGKNPLPEDLLDRDFSSAKECFEKCYLEFQLKKNGGIITKTAEAIGVYPSNLHGKMRKYGITTANAFKDEL